MNAPVFDIRRVEASDRTPRAILAALGAVIAVKLVLIFALALNSRFVMDEFEQLGWAKYFGHGLFETVWPAKAVGYAVFFGLAHVLGWDATSILLIGRLQSALLACGTLAIIYACARALGETKVRALVILIVLLSFSNVMERIFRTRAEPVSLFFAAGALLVVLRGNADRWRTLVVAGALSGAAFLTTQKAVYFNLALGLALVADAAFARRYIAGVRRGPWLVLGWLAPVLLYCFAFGGTDPIPVAKNLLLGPLDVATEGAGAYEGLRNFVLQTLVRNALLYALCFGGMAVAAARITSLDQRTRIALVFSLVITALIFSHDQPWPYVFVMALPFMALWSLRLFDDKRSRLATALIGVAFAVSIVTNLRYFAIDNRQQLQLIARAESLLGPDEIYFDGVAMLPNRREPSDLWLDRIDIRKTLREGRRSEAYRIFNEDPPKVIIRTERFDSIYPVVGPLVANSYVKVAPNVRIAGRNLSLGQVATFDVPIAGTYALYSRSGSPVSGRVTVNGRTVANAVYLPRGKAQVRLESGPAAALLLPQGSYAGLFAQGPDSGELFARVYE